MKIQEIHIAPTKTTPELLFDPKGYIKIKGRAIDESRANIPEEIISWIDGYLSDPGELTEITVALEFLNSFNTIILTSILKKFLPLKKQQKNLKINWYYEDDDVDLFERGEYISSIIDFPFEFTAVKKISEC